MQVTALWRGRVFITYERSEFARLVVALCGLDDVMPRGFHRPQVRIFFHALADVQRISKLAESSVDLNLIGREQLLGVRHFRVGIAFGVDGRKHAEIFGMVRHRQKIQRARIHLQIKSGGMFDRAAFGISVGFVRRSAHVEDIRIERVARVEVKVAEVGIIQRVRRRTFSSGGWRRILGDRRRSLIVARSQKRRSANRHR